MSPTALYTPVFQAHPPPLKASTAATPRPAGPAHEGHEGARGPSLQSRLRWKAGMSGHRLGTRGSEVCQIIDKSNIWLLSCESGAVGMQSLQTCLRLLETPSEHAPTGSQSATTFLPASGRLHGQHGLRQGTELLGCSPAATSSDFPFDL